MDIAIIGIAGRFPEAENINAFYRNLKEGKDSVREISYKRNKNTTISLDADYQIYGYLEDIDLFDYKFFNLSLSEAQNMDPQHRLALEVAYEVFENSGYNVDYYRGSNTGVYVGDIDSQYKNHASSYDPTLITGLMNAALAGRIARVYDLQGGATMVDTSCSSSLAALHFACNDLILGDTDSALVCGSKLVLFPALKDFGIRHNLDIISPDGKVRAFSAESNGAVSGEAVACILLKPLEKAIADNDIIHAVIKSSAMNQDAGLSASLTAPDSNAQAEVIKKAWRKAKIDPSTITYIEAHGTGTKLGDPIEVKGIDLAFSEFTSQKNFCAISSVKTNIGHTDSAAGITGLIKVVLSLKHKQLFPSLHYEKPNPFIDFANSTTFVNNKLNNWDSKTNIRRAGVSSFGLIGTNCHVVVEEFPQTSNHLPESDQKYLITVSAKSKSALISNRKTLAEYLSNPEAILRDISYTLNYGRKHYEYRFATIVDSKQLLISRLLGLDNSSEEASFEKAIFIFSDYRFISDKILLEFSIKYPIFKTHLEAIRSCVSNDEDSLNVFAFQYCLYRLLESLGIKSKFLLGDGIGKITLEALTEKISIEQGIKKALEYKSSSNTDLESRVKTLIEKEKGNKVLFLEIGFQGNISSQLKDQKSNQSNYEVLMLKEKSEEFLTYLKELYVAGFSIDFSKTHFEEGSRRIELPSYQFDKSRCWIKEPLEQNVSSYLYRLAWQQQPSGTGSRSQEGAYILFVNEEDEISEALYHQLKKSSPKTILVHLKNKFELIKTDVFSVDSEKEEDFITLKRELNHIGIEYSGIIHYANRKNQTLEISSSGIEDLLTKGLYAQFYITKSFDSILREKPISYCIITTNGKAVNAAESYLHPDATSLHGYLSNLQAEYPQCKVKGIDIDAGEAGVLKSKVVNQVLEELADQTNKIIVAFREGKRFLPSVQKIEESPAGDSVSFKEGGLYIITGGASGVGLEVAKRISKNYKVKLALIGRKVLPPKSDWHSLSKEHQYFDAIQEFIAIEQAGSQVQYYSTFLEDHGALKEVLKQLEGTLGATNGIVHAAGLPGKRRIKNHDYLTFKEALDPKIYGTINLAELTSSYSLDFFAMFSSHNSIVGGPKNSNYGAANIFQDAYAQLLGRKGIKAISINWPSWRETGMWKRYQEFNSEGPIDNTSLYTEEGIDAFEYILKLNESNVIVSKYDPRSIGNSPYFASDLDDSKEIKTIAQVLDPLPVSFQKPQETLPPNTSYNHEWTDIENKVAAIWKSVLKVDELSLEDDFFDLGGHSLNGTQVINKIEKELSIELEFEEILEYGTIKSLSGRIAELQSQGVSIKYEEIKPIQQREYYDVSHAQRRLWILDQFDEEHNAYNMPSAFIFEGKVDIDALQKAFSHVIDRHEILRTTFVAFNGELKQKIHDSNDNTFDFKFENLAGISIDEDRVGKIVNEEATKPFDLEKGPLLRIRLLQINEQKYLFLFTLHHIISDAWSMEVLIKEILGLYNGYKAGKEILLTPLSIQYKDYAYWQNSYLENLKKHQNYWIQQLSGELPVLTLSTDFSRPPIKTYSGKSIEFVLEQELSDEVHKISQKQGTTVFMTLLAAVKALLFRYTGQEDIIIGTPIAGRNHLDLENQIGLYLNTLALRTKFSGEESFESLLTKVKENTLKAYEHQAYPFDRLIDELNLKRDMSRSSLFDVMVGLRTVNAQEKGSSINMEGVDIKSFAIENTISKFDLTIDFIEAQNCIAVNVEYNTDLFTNERIELIISHLNRLLRSIGESPSQPLYKLNYLKEEEFYKQLVEFNTTEKDFNIIDPIHVLFEKEAEKFPDHLAAIHNEEEITYSLLNSKSNQISSLLKELGIGKEGFVGVFMERNINFFVAMMGILKSGGVYIPFDKQNPDKRTRALINNSEASVLISEYQILKEKPELFEHIPLVKNILCFEEADAEKEILENRYSIKIYDIKDILGKSTVNPVNCTKVDDWAYMLYTSGSTGEPKGALLRHDGAINHIFAEYEALELKEEFRFLQSANISSDISVWQFLAPVLRGGAVVIIDKDDLLNYNKLLNILNAHEVTIVEFVPSYLISFTEYLAGNEYVALPYLQWMMMVGEEIPVNLVNKWLSLYPATRVLNGYGPCEASDDITQFIINQLLDNTYKKVPIGIPLFNLNIFILDPYNQLVSLGAVGEIGVSGVGVGAGYWRDEEKTVKNFVINPFPDTLGEVIYKTGDLGRWLPDGNLEFLGRKDTQVKIRGFRVEVGEIEEVLRSHPLVIDAVVEVKRDNQGQKQLVGYIIPADSIPDANFLKELGKYTNAYLPDYMVPSGFVILNSFPLNLSDKVDRKALPEPEEIAFRKAEYVAPRYKLEEQLVGIWQEVLGREPIGIQDNFFEIGGHSLKATQVLFRIQKQLELKAELKDIFNFPTIDELAKVIGDADSVEYIPIVPVEKSPYYPVSHAQKRLWILAQFEQKRSSYNICETFIFNGILDYRSLQTAFEEIIRRHEILRTTFIMVDGNLKQRVNSTEECGFKLEKVNLVGEDEKEAYMQKIAMEEAVLPFDLEYGPLIRTKLLILSQEKHCCILTLHHIVSDEWSTDILFKDIINFYNHYKSGKEIVLNPLRIQYKDYSVWQQNQLAGENLSHHQGYWLAHLGGELSVLEFPTDFQRPANKTSNGAAIDFTIEEEVKKQLDDICKREEVSMFMMLVALTNAIFHKYTGQEDIIIGTPMTGRDHPDLEDQIGFYVNMQALRTRFSGEESFGMLLQKVKKVVLEALSHQQYPFDRLVDELDLTRDLSRSPLFDVMLTLQKVESGSGDELLMDGIFFEGFNRETDVSKYDLTLSFIESGNGLVGSIEYNTDLFQRSSIERFIVNLKGLLYSITKDIKQELSTLSYLSCEEKYKLLEEFNNTQKIYPKDITLQELFEEQVKKTPDNIAVKYGEIQLTYNQLNEESNRLAHYLRTIHKVKPNDSIGLMADRSENMVIGMLGIIKSGAAYVPIDPEYPDSRIEYILKDANISTLIVSKEEFIRRCSVAYENCYCLEWQTLQNYHTSNPSLINDAGDTAYVIYTSGSTGRSKGVEVRHRNLVNIAEGWKDAYQLNTFNVKLLQMASISFDVSIGDLCRALLTGGSLVICPAELRLDFERLYKLIATERINILESTPVVVIPLMKYIHEERLDVSFMKLLIIGSDSCLTEDFYFLIKNFGNNVRIINSYGTTETTIDSSYYETDIQHLRLTRNVPIGKPFYNTLFYILDQKMNLVPIGNKGELYIGGAGVAKGYLNREDLNRERFINNPLRPGETMYKTGDIARWGNDGNVEFLGREDHQVKIRGYRIELGEIENVFVTLPDIEKAVVGVSGEGIDKRVTVYFTTKSGNTQDVAPLRRQLEQRLPGYMIPSFFVQLELLPLTSNGKIDRASLPDPSTLGLSSGVVYEPPKNEIEEKLVGIWQDILDRDRIGVNDNFFEIGGYSIKAALIIQKVYKEFQQQISIQEIYNSPTVKGLAQSIEVKIHSNEPVIIFNESDEGVMDAFFIPGLTGTSVYFKALSEKFHDTINSYGLRYKGLESGESLVESVEELVGFLVDQILKVGASEDVILLGFSMGVPISFEVAKALESYNKKVRLILIDRSVEGEDDEEDQEFHMLLDDAFRIESGVADWNMEKDLSDSIRFKKFIKHTYEVVRNFKVRGVIKADIVTIEAEQNTPRTHMENWEALTSGNFEHHVIDSDHTSLIDKDELIQIINKSISVPEKNYLMI